MSKPMTFIILPDNDIAIHLLKTSLWASAYTCKYFNNFNLLGVNCVCAFYGRKFYGGTLVGGLFNNACKRSLTHIKLDYISNVDFGAFSTKFFKFFFDGIWTAVRFLILIILIIVISVIITIVTIDLLIIIIRFVVILATFRVFLLVVFGDYIGIRSGRTSELIAELF